MLLNSLSLIRVDKTFLVLIASAYLGVSMSFSDIYLFHLVLFSVCTIWFYRLKVNNYIVELGLLFKPHILFIVFLLIWYCISLFWTPRLELGIKYIFYIFCGLIITLTTLVYCSNIEKLNKLFTLLAYFIFLEIFIALFESFTSFRMPISSYSSIAHLFGKDPVNFSPGENIYFLSNISPPTGFRWNTNDLAICMTLSLPFFLCSRRSLLKIFGIASVTLIVAMTASRAAFLATLLIYFLYLLFVKKRIGTLFLIWFTSFGIFWTMNQLSESSNPRINEIANSIDAVRLYLTGNVDIGGSLEWRRELVVNGLRAFIDTKGIGLGAGGSVANQEIIGPVAGRFTSMHNFWIELLVEGGLIVALLTPIWLISAILKLFKISRSSNNENIKYYSESLFLSLVSFIPAAIAASSTIYFFPMWIMFGFSISVIHLSKL